MNSNNSGKPTTAQGNLAKLPRALAPLIERPQWTVWRWTQKPDGSWQKPPFMATQPGRHASTKDSTTWSDYSKALAAVQAGHADGISYILTTDDPLAAIDLDHCRDVDTHSIDVWAQNFLHRGRLTYSEVTPSGYGCRIWGFADGEPLNHVVKRQCGVLLIAAEGADEVRLRLDAVVREKCGGMARAPFAWYETAPVLLHKDAVENLVAMARQAEASLLAEHGLPLGLIIIDTISDTAGAHHRRRSSRRRHRHRRSSGRSMALGAAWSAIPHREPAGRRY